MKLLIGNFRGPEGKQGKKGEMGETGATGQRGSRWTSGTAVTGTSTAGTIFPETNITDAKLYDYYVNTDTGNLYECTVTGAADVAEWTHIGNIRGPAGATGPAGSISEIEEQKPTYTEAAKLENISSGETVKVAFGKLKKAVSVLIAHYTQKATAAILGHVKLSNSAAITKTGEYALDAVEKNASVAGTLANLIAQQNSNLNNYKSIMSRKYNTNWGRSLIVPGLAHGFIIISQHSVYTVWVAGSLNTFEVNTTSLCGANDATFTCEKENGTLTVTIPYDAGITYIGR